jgi:hypothetical protein
VKKKKEKSNHKSMRMDIWKKDEEEKWEGMSLTPLAPTRGRRDKF